MTCAATFFVDNFLMTGINYVLSSRAALFAGVFLGINLEYRIKTFCGAA